MRIDGASLRSEKSAGPVFSLRHLQHNVGEMGIVTNGDDGVPLQELTRGQAQMAFHANDIVGIEVHVRIPAAAGEAGHAGMTVEFKGIGWAENPALIAIRLM